MELALDQPVRFLNRLWQAVNVVGAQHRDMWKNFLDLGYWNVEPDE